MWNLNISFTYLNVGYALLWSTLNIASELQVKAAELSWAANGSVADILQFFLKCWNREQFLFFTMSISSHLGNATAVSKNDTFVSGNSSSALYEWEYYYDYLDPVIVDENKLKYNKCKFLCVTFTNLLLVSET